MESDTNSSQPRKVQASEILAKIEKGEPVKYDGVVVEGDLDLSELDLPIKHVERTEYDIEVLKLAEELKLVHSSISITNSDIMGNVNFKNATFQESAIFKETNFSCGNVYFGGAKFIGGADFRGAEFGGYASFVSVKFSVYAYFVSVKFDGIADFGDAEFSGNANFERAEFIGGNASFMRAKFYDGNTNFMRAEFSDDVDFGGAKFIDSNVHFGDAKFCDGNANFGCAQFIGVNADFGEAKFSRNADFVNAKFIVGSNAIFMGAEFNDDADFANAKFGGDTDFSGVDFSGNADFRNSQFGDGNANFGYAQFSDNRSAVTNFRNASFDGNINFKDTQFSPNTDFRAAQFNNSLDLTRARFDRLEIKWDSIRHHLICDETVYIALVNNYKSLAWFEDADNCLYQYRKWKQKNSGFGWLKIVDITSWITCGYGVRLTHALTCVFGLIFIFAVLYSSFSGITNSSTLDLPRDVIVSSNNTSQSISTYEDQVEPLSFFKCLYFSAMVLTGLVPEYLHPIGNWEYVVMIESVMGYLFLALFVVVLTRKLIR